MCNDGWTWNYCSHLLNRKRAVWPGDQNNLANTLLPGYCFGGLCKVLTVILLLQAFMADQSLIRWPFCWFWIFTPTKFIWVWVILYWFYSFTLRGQSYSYYFLAIYYYMPTIDTIRDIHQLTKGLINLVLVHSYMNCRQAWRMEKVQRKAMKMMNGFENDSGGNPKSPRGRKLKVNSIIVSKNTGLLNTRDWIIL